MRLLVLLLVVLLAGCGQTTEDRTDGPEVEEPQGDIRLERVADGFVMPLLLTHDGTHSYVVQQGGKVLRLPDKETAIDLTSRTTASGERGLLGIAFHPDDPSVVFASYTDRDGTSVLSRLRMIDGVADRAGEEILLTVDQPFSNHNGGHIAFGPDGMLYLGLGDGGSAADPQGNGQNKATLLGSMLRYAAGTEGPLQIPEDNPFVDDPTAADAVWSYGWRNPWRFSFDAEGDLWIADVGQNAYEELNREPAGAGGRNYGWNIYEGSYHFPSGTDVTRAPGFTFPVAQYGHGDHGGGQCSITGGHVYRGPVTALQGSYVFGDYCSGDIWRFDDAMSILLETDMRISSFGEDAAGELYVIDHQGVVHRFAA